jgi:DNA-binding CsgD family transcriptional regulator
MYRESLRVLFESNSLSVAEAMASADALEGACRAQTVDAVVFEAAGVVEGVPDLVERLRACDASTRLVATYPSELRGVALEGALNVHRSAPGAYFLAAVSGDAGPPTGEDQGENQGEEPVAGREGVTLWDPGAEVLTKREMQVLALISGGLTTQQIAERLGISAKTVESRRQGLFAKLGVQSQSHAVSVAIRAGFLGNRPDVALAQGRPQGQR